MNSNFGDETRTSYHRALGVPVFQLPGEGETAAPPPAPDLAPPPQRRNQFAAPVARSQPKPVIPPAPRISRPVSWEYPTPMVSRQGAEAFFYSLQATLRIQRISKKLN